MVRSIRRSGRPSASCGFADGSDTGRPSAGHDPRERFRSIGLSRGSSSTSVLQEPVGRGIVAALLGEVLLETMNLTRRFGPVVALDALTLQVRAGECVAMMGPNGSGKTTTAELIGGLLEPSEGRVEICGHSIHNEPEAVAARRDLAYVPDTARLYDDLTVRDHLRLVAAAHGVADHDLETKAAALLERLGLTERVAFFPRQLSRGMRQKTVLACAFIRPFRVLVLDEPIVGLDAASVAAIREMVQECKEAGKAVLLMTHAQTFAAKVATRVLRLEEGRVLDS